MDRKSDEASLAEAHSPYWRLMRDVLVFQCKLALDGLRDLLLSPLSIIFAIAGAVLSPKDPHRFLRRLMHFGRQTDQFINLFEHSESVHDPSSAEDHHQPYDAARETLHANSHDPLKHGPAKAVTVSSSTYVKQLEDLLIDEYRKGGIVKGVKEGTDEVVRKLLARRQTPRK
jgi:hypothetical protein